MEKINREPAPSGKAAGRKKGAGCVKAHHSFSGGSLSFTSVAANRKPVRKKDSTQKGTDKKQSQSTVQETAVSAMEEYAGKQERELEKVLSKVKGIGDVDVMVTIASSEEKRTLKQEDSSNSSTNESDSTGGSRTQSESSTKTEPVLVGEEGKEPYIIQIASPQIEGVLVVAQGAGSGAMDSEIIAAVEALFPIESHKIKVMKMR